MSFWTPIENPGTRPARSWVFDVGCAASAAMASFGSFSFAETAHPAHPPLAVSLVVAVLTTLVLPLRRVWPGPVFGVVVLMAAVLAQWPVPGQLYPVPLAIGLYTVAATMSRAAPTSRCMTSSNQTGMKLRAAVKVLLTKRGQDVISGTPARAPRGTLSPRVRSGQSDPGGRERGWPGRHIARGTGDGQA